MPNRFCRYQLRTADVDAARTFYEDLLGPGFWVHNLDITLLPSQAAARGAPAHWLGYIGVEDAVGTMFRFLELGAARLGPHRATIGADEDVLLRDPSGAVVALTPRLDGGSASPVAWHLLTTRDEAAAFGIYAQLFGWTAVATSDPSSHGGRHVTFAWNGGARPVGSVADIARQPNVHPQWLFFFPTPNLEQSLQRVRDLDGLPLRATATPEGHLVAPCDDPQGAAFALCQINGARERRDR